MPIKILVFESDAGFAEQLRVGFAALGCETTVVDDANPVCKPPLGKSRI